MSCNVSSTRQRPTVGAVGTCVRWAPDAAPLSRERNNAKASHCAPDALASVRAGALPPRTPAPLSTFHGEYKAGNSGNSLQSHAQHKSPAPSSLTKPIPFKSPQSYLSEITAPPHSSKQNERMHHPTSRMATGHGKKGLPLQLYYE